MRGYCGTLAVCSAGVDILDVARNVSTRHKKKEAREPLFLFLE
jgi:hypothetical protein